MTVTVLFLALLILTGAEHGISSDGFFELEDLPKYVITSSYMICRLKLLHGCPS